MNFENLSTERNLLIITTIYFLSLVAVYIFYERIVTYYIKSNSIRRIRKSQNIIEKILFKKLYSEIPLKFYVFYLAVIILNTLFFIIAIIVFFVKSLNFVLPSITKIIGYFNGIWLFITSIVFKKDDNFKFLKRKTGKRKKQM